MKSVKKSYQRSYQRHHLSPKALKWHSKKAAQQRYEQIVADLDFNNKSILDVGCGFGDIIPYIAAKAVVFDYTGIDLVPEFIREAAGLHPEHKFIVGDYFKQPLEERFDIIICCGVLNGQYDDNLGFRKKAIQTMFEHVNQALVFNMAGRHPQPKTARGSNVWFADSKKILEYCQALSSQVLFKDDYHSSDFTIVMKKSRGKGGRALAFARSLLVHRKVLSSFALYSLRRFFICLACSPSSLNPFSS